LGIIQIGWVGLSVHTYKFTQPFSKHSLRPYSLPPTFSLALFYPEHGLLFYNQDGQGEYFENGNTLSVKVCAKHFSASYSGFYLWNSNKSKTFEQTKPYTYTFSNHADLPFRPLEEVTNLDIPAFTKAFSSPNSTACFLSPIDIWPFPLK
jgi:hypothetical protein